MSGRDQLFDTPQPPQDFAFDESVVGVFPDMIQRSVPGYALVIEMSALLAARHIPAGGVCFDLGCSLGATSLALQRVIHASNVRVLGIDSAPAMVARAQANLAVAAEAQGRARSALPVIEFRCADLLEVDCTGAHAVLMNFTMQFVPAAKRLALLTRLRGQLAPGGVLLYAEKLAISGADDPQTRADAGVLAWDEDAHLDFKRANGYTELAIAQKRTALENVMQPDSFAQHQTRLNAAGFSWQHCWFRCLNWAAFAARP